MTGQLVKAEETFAYLLETSERRHGEQSNAALAITNDLVSMYVQQGRIDEAEKLGAHTIEMARHVFGESGTPTLIMERQMANIYCEQERYDLAEALLDRNLNIMSNPGSERITEQGSDGDV
ncbi:kinesin light chain [Verticillium dahliae]